MDDGRASSEFLIRSGVEAFGRDHIVGNLNEVGQTREVRFPYHMTRGDRPITDFEMKKPCGLETSGELSIYGHEESPPVCVPVPGGEPIVLPVPPKRTDSVRWVAVDLVKNVVGEGESTRRSDDVRVGFSTDVDSNIGLLRPCTKRRTGGVED